MREELATHTAQLAAAPISQGAAKSLQELGESTLGEDAVKKAEEVLDQLTPVLAEYGLRAVGAVIFFIVALYVARFFRKATVRALERAKLEPTLARFLGAIVRWGILILAVIACLGIFGVQTTSFAAVLASAGLAIGLALQGSLSNIAAGAMLAIFRPFRVGDIVNVAGHLGKVYEIELFNTRIDTFDNRRVIIPNAQVFNGVIENVTFNPIRRVDIDVGVEYHTDLAKAREVLIEAVRNLPDRATERDPDAVVTAFADSAITFQVRVWTPSDKWLDTRQAAFRSIKVALDKAGIGIPFPQRVVHVRQKEG